MKVILTEEQLNLVKLIKENTEFGEKMKESIKDVKTRAEKMYNLITYTTIAEYRDKNDDGGITKGKFDTLEDEYELLKRKVEDFQNRYMDGNHNWVNPMAEELYTDLDGRLENIKDKMTGLGRLTDGLIHVLHNKVHEPFKTIKPINI